MQPFRSIVASLILLLAVGPARAQAVPQRAPVSVPRRTERATTPEARALLASPQFAAALRVARGALGHTPVVTHTESLTLAGTIYVTADLNGEATITGSVARNAHGTLRVDGAWYTPRAEAPVARG